MNQEKNPETLLFNTCFALNKSHSKFVFLGLQYFAKEFRPVIQFGGGTSPHKYVTMDKQSWEKFTEHFGTIQEYMINDERGPRKITMPSHNITMMTCYSAKAVSVTQSPEITQPNFSSCRYEHESQHWDTDDGRCTPSCNQDAVDEPPNKKRKIENLPCVVMQLNTFAHLKKLRDCINFRFKQLENNVVFVNAALEIIINNIKICIHQIYDSESIIHVFFDGITFVRIFDELEEKLKSIVNNRVSYSNFRETDVDRLFLDLRTLYLPMLEKAVHEVVQ